MEMPKPGSPHQKLQRLSGKWTGEEKMHPSPWDPKGGAATGRILNRLSLDGFVVVQDYEQERSGNISRARRLQLQSCSAMLRHALVGYDGNAAE